ncbi:MAG: diacylglycerol kinase family lipid kinase [Cyclobacteriaceae bacterium]|nr:diacylglycerol kinase family lipid kinase [Cyclobacteriaceae bacterium HetDA_MAG_MS6]
MSRKVFVLVNPNSGSRHTRKLVNELSQFLLASNIAFHIAETSVSTRGTETVRTQLDASFTDLVIVGGDGTINESINGLDFDIPVSFLPAGTGDDFVKTLDIGKTLQDRLKIIAEGLVHTIDLGVCNGRKFINGVGIGFDGQIVADMQHRKVPLLSGQAKYYYHVLHILSSYRDRKFDLKIEEEKDIRQLILMTVANGTTFGGGFKLTPRAKIDDGLLDVCEVGKISALRRYLNILRLQNGTHHVLKEVNMYRTSQISIEENQLLEGHIDGEYLGKPPFEIKTLSNALKIRARSVNR